MFIEAISATGRIASPSRSTSVSSPTFDDFEVMSDGGSDATPNGLPDRGGVRFGGCDAGPGPEAKPMRSGLMLPSTMAIPPRMKKIACNGKSFAISDRSLSAYPEYFQELDAGAWEEDTFSAFDAVIDGQTTFFDVGAWIGTTLLYGSATAAMSIGLEPDPVAFAALKENVELNPTREIKLFDTALSDNDADLMIGSAALGESVTSALIDTGDQVSVKSMTVTSLLKAAGVDGSRPLFMKMDIEGYEYSILANVASRMPLPQSTFFISLHPQILLQFKRKETSGRQPSIAERVLLVREHLKLLSAFRGCEIATPWGISYNRITIPLLFMLAPLRIPRDVLIVHKSNRHKRGLVKKWAWQCFKRKAARRLRAHRTS